MKRPHVCHFHPRRWIPVLLVSALLPCAWACRQADEQAAPPKPPLLETFEGSPVLSLFPWVGDFRPQESDSTRMAYWKTYREHLEKTSGILSGGTEKTNHAFGFRGLKGADSLGFFSPIGVEPGRSYSISLRVQADLPEDASTGLGITEFSEFLWIPGQYGEDTFRRYHLRSQELFRLRETKGWETRHLIFNTGPQTRMIHLVFFREGVPDKTGILIDDIVITAHQ